MTQSISSLFVCSSEAILIAALSSALVFTCKKKKPNPSAAVPPTKPNAADVKITDVPLADKKPASEKKDGPKKSEKQKKSEKAKKSEKEKKSEKKKSEKEKSEKKKSEKKKSEKEKEKSEKKKSEKKSDKAPKSPAKKEDKSDKDPKKSDKDPKKSDKKPKEQPSSRKEAKKEPSDKPKKDSKMEALVATKAKEAGEKDDEKPGSKKDGSKRDGSKKSEVKDAEKEPKQGSKKSEVKDADKEPKQGSKMEAPSAHMTAVQMIGKELTIDPKELRFSADGGITKLNLTNNTGLRIAIKIKCSDNDLYRLNPVYSLIEKDGKFAVDVSRVKGTAKADKLAVVYTEATADATDAQAVFKSAPPAEKITTTNVPMFVT